MAQPKEPPISIRPGKERLAMVSAWATDHGLSQHAAILALVDLGLGAKVEAPALDVKAAHREIAKRYPKVLAELAKGPDETVAAKVSVPYAGDFKRAPMQKTPKKR